MQTTKIKSEISQQHKPLQFMYRAILNETRKLKGQRKWKNTNLRWKFHLREMWRRSVCPKKTFSKATEKWTTNCTKKSEPPTVSSSHDTIKTVSYATTILSQIIHHIVIKRLQFLVKKLHHSDLPSFKIIFFWQQTNEDSSEATTWNTQKLKK